MIYQASQPKKSLGGMSESFIFCFVESEPCCLWVQHPDLNVYDPGVFRAILGWVGEGNQASGIYGKTRRVRPLVASFGVHPKYIDKWNTWQGETTDIWFGIIFFPDHFLSFTRKEPQPSSRVRIQQLERGMIVAYQDI